MVERQYKVVWNTTARKQVRKIYDYILEDSVQNAKKILAEIIISSENYKQTQNVLEKIRIRKTMMELTVIMNFIVTE